MMGDRQEAWGIIPARGGSKSIPYKNLVEVAGRPLIDYSIMAAKDSRLLTRIICSTDDPRIAAHSKTLGIEIDMRPSALAQDDSLVTDVVLDLIERSGASPDIVVLLQPTSPFILGEHVDRIVLALRADDSAASAQTIIACPHNSHAINQRAFDGGHVSFVFESERLSAYNKQRKAKHYLFGNLVATKAEVLAETRNLFARPSLGIEVPRIFGFDLDDADDLKVADAIIAAGLVPLPTFETKEGY
jgi:CMP-N-acetylneuraminic acid synthetase